MGRYIFNMGKHLSEIMGRDMGYHLIQPIYIKKKLGYLYLEDTYIKHPKKIEIDDRLEKKTTKLVVTC